MPSDVLESNSGRRRRFRAEDFKIAPDEESKTSILVVPGNPGCGAYYTPFARHLAKVRSVSPLLAPLPARAVLPPFLHTCLHLFPSLLILGCRITHTLWQSMRSQAPRLLTHPQRLVSTDTGTPYGLTDPCAECRQQRAALRAHVVRQPGRTRRVLRRPPARPCRADQPRGRSDRGQDGARDA